jgi:hypothetical protein
MLPGARSLALTGVLIANAFPGSCGDPRYPRLILSPTDCACLPATVAVTVEGATSPPVTLVCGKDAEVLVDHYGRRLVTVHEGTVVWHRQDYVLATDKDVRIALACPRR